MSTGHNKKWMDWIAGSMLALAGLVLSHFAQACVLFHDRFEITTELIGGDACPGPVWYGSFWQDGSTEGQHAMIVVTNLGSTSQTVRVTFYSPSGEQLAMFEQNLPGGQQLRLVTETGTGGIEDTAEGSGFVTIVAEQPQRLLPWSALLWPATEDRLTGVSASWTLR